MPEEKENRWIENADDDLRAAEITLQQKLFGISAFHSQQSVEKALKALQLKKFNKISKVHDLVFLGNEVGMPEKFVEYCKEMTGAYIYTRYPEMPEDVDIEKSAGKFIKWAEEVIAWIKPQLQD